MLLHTYDCARGAMVLVVGLIRVDVFWLCISYAGYGASQKPVRKHFLRITAIGTNVDVTMVIHVNIRDSRHNVFIGAPMWMVRTPTVTKMRHLLVDEMQTPLY